jgi:Coenzyme PQQ synthesis protein D (PqqD).
MKLNSNFIVHQAGGNTIIVPTASAGFSGVVKGNQTLGSIVNLLQREVTEAEIISTMKAIYDAPEGLIEGDVRKALAELRSIGAIDE